MAYKNVPFSELRPFSVEDPFGTGARGQSAADRRRDAVRAERLQRQEKAKLRANQVAELAKNNRRGPRASTLRASGGQGSAQAAQAPVVAAAPQMPRVDPQAKKGLGCLSTLFFIGIVIAAGNLLIAPAIREIKQFILQETGTNGKAKLLTFVPQSNTPSDKPVYLLTLDVQTATGPTTTTIEQALEPDVAAQLSTGMWLQIMYDKDDLSDVVVVGPTGKPADRPTLSIQDVEPEADPEAPAQNAPLTDNSAQTGQEPDSGANPSQVPDAAAEAAVRAGISPACTQAYRCCLVVQTDKSTCDLFLNPDLTASTCGPSYVAYQRVAEALDKSCPQ